jgi:N-acetylglutamate synthase-like GNAT family acetyltransferase
MSLTLQDLRQAPEHLKTLATWHHHQWAALNPGQTLTQRLISMQAYLAEGPIPSTFIALQAGQLAGSAAIVQCDMDTHPEWTPWLASVYVNPEFRQQGLGSALVRHAMSQARQAGFPGLYLFTPDKAPFYQALGWQTLQASRYRDHEVTVMQVTFVDL